MCRDIRAYYDFYNVDRLFSDTVEMVVLVGVSNEAYD